jgi:lauroyl/myristoyl acyltransferase
MGRNRWREEARAAREAAEDRLPARFLTLETSARALHRRLAAGGLVGIAFDGRIGSRFLPLQWLGRTCLLNPGPARLALATGAPLVPAFCETGREGPGICRLGAPMWPEGRDAAALLAAFVHQHAEPWVRTHPEEYGPWLLHCRMRAAVDDHPFFLDYAPDDRYRRHLPPGFSPTASRR